MCFGRSFGKDVLLPPEVLDMLGGAQSEESSLAQSSRDLRVDSGNVEETEVSSGILPEKAQEHIEDSQRNITSCRNEVEHWVLRMRRHKILGESIGQLVIPKCRRTEVLKLAHTSVFSSHMGPKKTRWNESKYSFFWEGLRADVKKFCESCKECQLTRSVRIKDRSSSTPVARPELPFEVGNMDLIGPIDPPSLKGHKYILRRVDQHTRWGEAVPLTSLSAKVGRVRNSCLHLATGRTRDDIGKRIWQRRGRKRSERERRRGGEEKAGVLKSRHGWTMYGNPVTSEYILDFKKFPIEGME
ncbi:retrovirus-related Pol polyprotein from transposon opus [Trichonephila clavipes]|nr:retrovirus-related Pol polyprotein from transposon opus [Trichonephila clavipes]